MNAAVRRYLRPGCGLVCRRPAVRGLPTGRRHRDGGCCSWSWGGQHPGHHQVSLLEDDLENRSAAYACIVRRSYIPRRFGAVCLHPYGHRTYSETTHPAGALRPHHPGRRIEILLAGDPCVNGTEVRRLGGVSTGKWTTIPKCLPAAETACVKAAFATVLTRTHSLRDHVAAQSFAAVRCFHSSRQFSGI